MVHLELEAAPAATLPRANQYSWPAGESFPRAPPRPALSCHATPHRAMPSHAAPLRPTSLQQTSKVKRVRNFYVPGVPICDSTRESSSARFTSTPPASPTPAPPAAEPLQRANCAATSTGAAGGEERGGVARWRGIVRHLSAGLSTPRPAWLEPCNERAI